MADLAQIAIAIVADPSGFESALMSAQKAAVQFGQSVTGVFNSLDSAMTAISANPIGASLMAAVKAAQLLQTAVTGIRDAAASARDEFGAMVADGMRQAEEQRKLMRRTGLDSSSAGGLMNLGRQAGMDAGEMQHALARFSVRMGEAASGTGIHGAGAALARLGLNARELAQIPVDQQLARIGDALKSVSNPAERASLMMQVLGHRGMELERIMGRGSEGMKKANDQAKEWGLTLSDADLETVKRARYAQQELAAAEASIRQGVANSLAVSMAPSIEHLSTIGVEMVEMAQGPLGVLRDGIRQVGKLLDAFWDGIQAGWQEVAPLWNSLKSDLDQVWREFKEAIGGTDDLKETLRALGSLLVQFVVPSVVNLGQQFVLLARSARAQFELLLNSIRIQVDALKEMINNAADTLAGILEAGARAPGRIGDAFQDAADQLERMRATMNNFQVPSLGGSGDSNTDQLDEERRRQMVLTARAALGELAHAFMDTMRTPADHFNEQLQNMNAWLQAGALEADQWANALNRMVNGNEPITRYTDQIELLRAQLQAGARDQASFERASRDAARNLWGNAQTPLEEFRNRMEEIDRLFQQTGDMDNYSRAAMAALDRANGTDNRVQLASGITAGSAASISLLNQATVNQPQDVQTRMAATMDRLQAQAQAQTQIQQEMMRYLQNRPGPRPASVVD